MASRGLIYLGGSNRSKQRTLLGDLSIHSPPQSTMAQAGSEALRWRLLEYYEDVQF